LKLYNLRKNKKIAQCRNKWYLVITGKGWRLKIHNANMYVKELNCGAVKRRETLTQRSRDGQNIAKNTGKTLLPQQTTVYNISQSPTRRDLNQLPP